MIDRRMVTTKYLYTLNNGTALSYERPFSGFSVGRDDGTFLLLDQILFVLTQHQAVLNLVAAGDVVEVLQLLQDVVGQVHVRDTLLRNAG